MTYTYKQPNNFLVISATLRVETPWITISIWHSENARGIF